MFGAPLAVWRGRAEAKGWQVVESLCAFAQPAGKTVKKVYESFRDEILADLEASDAGRRRAAVHARRHGGRRL